MQYDFLSVERFLDEFLPAVVDERAAVFAGAGLSRSAGFVDWKGLLGTFADELHLDLDVETDLSAVAQYHLNRHGRVRDRLNQRIAEELGRQATPGEVHAGLAQIPIQTYWTSNYDGLIEEALKANGRAPVVRHKGASLTSSPRGKTCEVLKLHGDSSDPSTVVVTKEDYEAYARDNKGLLERLKTDLICKSFLFMGFSFTDPNLELIFAQVRQLVGDSPRSHYAIFRQPQRSEFSHQKSYKYELNRWHLRLEDLTRYGVHPVIITDYDELPEILREVRLRMERRRVLVSGSFAGGGPWNREQIEGFSQALGERIIAEGYDLANGFGLGIGSPLIAGALEELYRGTPQFLERRLLLRPFPQTRPRNISRATLWTNYRRDLIGPSGFVVFVAGSKIDSEGNVVLANGVREEYTLAREMKKYPLPVGASGCVAAELWDECHQEFNTIFPRGTSRRDFRVLGSDRSTSTEILDALFRLVRALTPRRQ